MSRFENGSSSKIVYSKIKRFHRAALMFIYKYTWCFVRCFRCAIQWQRQTAYHMHIQHFAQYVCVFRLHLDPNHLCWVFLSRLFNQPSASRKSFQATISDSLLFRSLDSPVFQNNLGFMIFKQTLKGLYHEKSNFPWSLR